MFIDDMNTLKNFSNTKIRVYENKVTGEYAYEVEQPKNNYVPERSRFYSNKKKGLSFFEIGNSEERIE